MYNIGYMIATYIGQLIAVSTAPLMPYFTKIMAIEEYKESASNILKSINYSYCLVIVPLSLYIVGFIFSGRDFIPLVFKIYDTDTYFVGVILSLYISLFSSQQPFSRLFYAKAKHHHLLKLSLIEVGMIFLFSVLLTPLFGIVGQAFAVFFHLSTPAII
ncbi:hypothetical protein L3081_00890 [Colwellia sp. MSW7]|uniref:Polysaccharide biosynthesis protein n=1 Tax=Colwellia maritima TaxID=2912588 RepID=A0ABS9WWE1_9GAMM|nr:hypothetical protein [Colwellia maritima]MCI2282218.1 hypothetical protein [Colwellia maritima]